MPLLAHQLSPGADKGVASGKRAAIPLVAISGRYFFMTLPDKRDRLLNLLRRLDRCAVAFSGGVDSAVVAKAACEALGERAVAVTGVSPSLADGELQQAQQVAQLIGIRHVIVQTQEFASQAYTRNAPDRCYHCKSELYTQLERLAPELGAHTILNGANADDIGDYRPGMTAASEHRVRSPLAECGLSKQDVRDLARHWRLPVWDKPATPCLSSRVAYGEQVTPERLAMIDQAERWLRAQGLDRLRVRYHRGDLARIEVPVSDLVRLCDDRLRQHLVTQMKALGFKFVTIDLEGFRSGSLNTLVPLDTLTRAAQSRGAE